MTAVRVGFRIAGARCDCGAVKLVAVRPGSEDVRAANGRKIIKRGVPQRGECARCAPWWRASKTEAVSAKG